MNLGPISQKVATMQTTNILAVATSVSMDRGFDTLDAIAYAINNGFKGFQAFINQQIIKDAQLRGQVRTICEDNHLTLIAHAPATLKWSNVSDDSINSAIMNLLASESKALVVHHYDETVPFKETLKCLQYLRDRGCAPCLENFFMRGGDTSEKSFKDYLLLLKEAKNRSIELIPVFDIPRLYDSQVKLAHRAHLLIENALNVFKLIETPIILHLIDTYNDAQIRSSWCPLGQGIIPYTNILQQLKQRRIPIYMVILEFEDRINPIESKRFLEEHLIGPD